MAFIHRVTSLGRGQWAHGALQAVPQSTPFAELTKGKGKGPTGSATSW